MSRFGMFLICLTGSFAGTLAALMAIGLMVLSDLESISKALAG